MHSETCPLVTDKPSLPSEHEVKVIKTYHYEPCPLEVKIHQLKIPFIHELLKPDCCHVDRFWLDLLPKKLHETLSYVSGQQAVGWGIQINEELNWFLILAFVLCLLAIAGAGVIVYALLGNDISSAAGLGAFIVAGVTLYVTVHYFS